MEEEFYTGSFEDEELTNQMIEERIIEEYESLTGWVLVYSDARTLKYIIPGTRYVKEEFLKDGKVVGNTYRKVVTVNGG